MISNYKICKSETDIIVMQTNSHINSAIEQCTLWVIIKIKNSWVVYYGIKSRRRWNSRPGCFYYSNKQLADFYLDYDWVDYTVHETLSSDLELDPFKAILFSSTLVSSTIIVIQTVFFNIVSIYILYIYKEVKVV